jgi:hypothetical protein
MSTVTASLHKSLLFVVMSLMISMVKAVNTYIGIFTQPACVASVRQFLEDGCTCWTRQWVADYVLIVNCKISIILIFILDDFKDGLG